MALVISVSSFWTTLAQSLELCDLPGGDHVSGTSQLPRGTEWPSLQFGNNWPGHHDYRNRRSSRQWTRCNRSHFHSWSTKPQGVAGASTSCLRVMANGAECSDERGRIASVACQEASKREKRKEEKKYFHFLWPPPFARYTHLCHSSCTERHLWFRACFHFTLGPCFLSDILLASFIPATVKQWSEAQKKKTQDREDRKRGKWNEKHASTYGCRRTRVEPRL